MSERIEGTFNKLVELSIGIHPEARQSVQTAIDRLLESSPEPMAVAHLKRWREKAVNEGEQAILDRAINRIDSLAEPRRRNRNLKRWSGISGNDGYRTKLSDIASEILEHASRRYLR